MGAAKYSLMTVEEKKARELALKYGVDSGNMVKLEGVTKADVLYLNPYNANAFVRGRTDDELFMVIDFSAPLDAAIVLPATITTISGEVINVAEALMGYRFHMCDKKDGASRIRIKAGLFNPSEGKKQDANIEEFLMALMFKGRLERIGLKENELDIHHEAEVWNLKKLMCVNKKEHAQIHNGDHSHKKVATFDMTVRGSDQDSVTAA